MRAEWLMNSGFPTSRRRADPPRLPDRREFGRGADQELHLAGQLMLFQEAGDGRRLVPSRVDRHGHELHLAVAGTRAR